MISGPTVRDFIEKAKERLEGDWLILGGSLIPLIDQSYRSTMDIDVVRLDGASNEDTLALMSIAQEVGLPVEAINMAAAFFVSKIESPKKKVIEIFHSEKMRIFRPTFYLYLELKSARLSESDLSDLLKYLSYTIEKKEPFLKEECFRLLEAQVPSDTNQERNKRRKKLLKAIQSAEVFDL